MKKRHLEAARITKPVGLRGEMRAQLYCDGCEMLTGFGLYLGKELKPVEITAAVPLKNDMCRIRIKGIVTIEEAQPLAGKILYLDREEAQLPPDTWFIADIIGLPVYDIDSGVRYGVINDVIQNGPTDVYSVKAQNGRELLFPAIPEVLINVDIEGEKILIRPLEGLFDEESGSSDEN